MTQPTSVRHRYLLGAMPQLAIVMQVRYQGIAEDVDRLPQIIEAWRRASARMLSLATEQAGLPDQIHTEEPPDEIRPRLHEIAADPLFQASFSDVPASFMIVELDKLVAPQREVNLDFVSSLRTRLPGKGWKELLEFLLVPRAEHPEIKTLQSAQNQIVFSSPSLDLRFLGGFPKPMGEDDVRVALMGGQPVKTVALLIGFGAAPANAWLVGRRLVLANGFHRIIALRMEGVTHAPIVVRRIANPDIEFPEQHLGLSRAYLLQNQRPVVVGDFFDDDLTLEINLKRRRKTLKIAWGAEEGIVPE